MIAGEFELIDKIRRRVAVGEGVRIGIGDDCSVFEVPPGEELLTSTDLLLEGVHFRLDWTDFYRLGRKAVSVNVSDIAAMGGRPLCLYLGLGIPEKLEDSELDQFLDGFSAALSDYGASLAGGDTCRSAYGMTIAVTVQGLCTEGQAVCRSGAEPGDDLWVSGSLGDSALALKLLQAGQEPPASLAERHFNPEARSVLGKELGRERLATAMLDLSDGLVGDLRHLLRASGCGARIQLEQLPLSGDYRKSLNTDAERWNLALTGGEDYELLFAAHADSRAQLEGLAQRLMVPLTRIGVLTPDAGERTFLTNEGANFSPEMSGFDHFSSRGAVDD